MSELDIIELIIVSVIGSGGLAFFIKYGSRLAVLESRGTDLQTYIHDQAKLNLDGRIAQVEVTMTEVRHAIAKLNQMDMIADRVERIMRALEVQMSRQEAELRLREHEVRMDSIQKTIDRLDDK